MVVRSVLRGARALPAVWIVGCAYDPEAFSDDFAKATCRQEARCSPDSWYLTDGRDACIDAVDERFGFSAIDDDPCLVFDEAAARDCIDAIGDTCDERVLSFQIPAACNEVYVWDESCSYAVPGFVGVRRARRTRTA